MTTPPYDDESGSRPDSGGTPETPQNPPAQNPPVQNPPPGYVPQPGYAPPPGYAAPPGYAPPPGYPSQGPPAPPGMPGPPPPIPPQPPKKSRALLISGIVVGAVVLLVVGIAALFFLVRAVADSESSESRDRAPSRSSSVIDEVAIGACVYVTSARSTEVAITDCDDDERVTLIVGDKLTDSDACEAAGYSYYYTERGVGASRKALCLVPNFQVDTCYQESSVATNIDLEVVSCSKTSGAVTAVYKITERVDSTTVPNCTDTAKQKAMAYRIEASPARELGYCAEIMGDYEWE